MGLLDRIQRRDAPEEGSPTVDADAPPPPPAFDRAAERADRWSFPAPPAEPATEPPPEVAAAVPALRGDHLPAAPAVDEPPANNGATLPAVRAAGLPEETLRRAPARGRRGDRSTPTRSPFRLGEVLVQMGLVRPDQLEDALAKQRLTGKRLGALLVEDRYITEYDLSQALATSLGFEYIALGDQRIDPAAAGLIADKLARRYLALPYAFEDERTVLVAMSDPTNVFAVDDLRVLTGFDVKVTVSSAAEINQAIGRFHRPTNEISIDEEQDGGAQVTDIREAVDDAPVVKLVNAVISQAVDDGASDIHFEPGQRECVIRFRVDGVLQRTSTVPHRLQAGVISRLKIMSDLDIAERRMPQDGRIALNVGGKGIDLRVASLPTVYGEKIVMRILDRSNVMIELPRMGFTDEAYARFESSFRKPYGAVLVTGPTGSGKSTTLYAALNVLNDPAKNIITVEDPVEYRLTGINQVQVNPKAGLTWAAGLKSILRCDPDIIMVGEIRDRDTAQIAIESALTGHLVLSTLHTNNAPGALSRLNEMGIEPFLTGSAVDSVLAQRLCRRLCNFCREEFFPEAAFLSEAGFGDDVVARAGEVALFRGRGCARCNHTGYKGRMGVYEVMLVSEEIERMVVARQPTDEIGRQAVAEGMVTLRDDGLAKALAGHTTVEEVARVIV